MLIRAMDFKIIIHCPVKALKFLLLFLPLPPAPFPHPSFRFDITSKLFDMEENIIQGAETEQGDLQPERGG